MAATRRWLTPSRALCLETHQIRPYPQPSPPAGVYARGLGSKVDVPSRQRSPSPRTRRRRGGCGSALTPIQVCDGPGKQGSVSLRPSLRIAATAALDRRPEARAVARMTCASSRQHTRHQSGRCLGAVRRTYRPVCTVTPGMHRLGARSIRRPQSVAIPRWRHLGRPRIHARRRLGAKPKTHGFATACFSPENVFIRASGSVGLPACLSPALRLAHEPYCPPPLRPL
jgi:hypothetical protein